MLKINAIKIDITTFDGRYGCKHTFQKGLNIIRGDNSSGKSSMFQAILYALGLEELLGGKNEKTMQSVLKDIVEYPNGDFHRVIQSYVYLEIENNDIVTVKRAINSPTESPKLIDVYYGALLTGNNSNLTKQSMYIHDKGGASDKNNGFHLFLATFLGWKMPEVPNTQGQITHLYIQQIAPSFIIEQKSGWADFLATMPYYNIKQASSRVIEFVLNMDIFEIQKKKQAISIKEDELKERWKTSYIKIDNIARDTRFTLQGVTDRPSIVNEDDIYLIKNIDSGSIDIEHEMCNLQEEYSKISDNEVKTVGENSELFEEQLRMLQNQHSLKSYQYDMISSDVAINEQQLKLYEEQLSEIENDLSKNKSYKKILQLGGEVQCDVAKSVCPTCHQRINDSLLPHDIHQEPMRIDDNIKYLESEKGMIEKYIEGQKKFLQEQSSKQKILQEDLKNIRTDIRRIKKDLTENSRIPSVAEIEYRLNLSKKIEFYERKIEEFMLLKQHIYQLSKEYLSILSEKKQIDSNYSENDKRKISAFEQLFTNRLRDFKYKSKPINTIKISHDNYMPITYVNTGENYNIRFDSSASDFIRCILAYYISLMQTSIKYQGNHPKLLMFDEPKQQDMSEEDFKVFLKILSEFTEEQILVFASFSNNDESFISDTKNIKFNLVRIEDKLIVNI